MNAWLIALGEVIKGVVLTQRILIRRAAGLNTTHLEDRLRHLWHSPTNH